MDERSPLENRSLTHTSKEPEGQAWAQIAASKPKGSTTKGDMPFTAKEATGAKGEAPATSETESKSSPSKATAEKNKKKDATAAAPLEQKEDAVNGRPLSDNRKRPAPKRPVVANDSIRCPPSKSKPVCCKCNRSGRCSKCTCVKAGRNCHNCLPGRLNQCSNNVSNNGDLTRVPPSQHMSSSAIPPPSCVTPPELQVGLSTQVSCSSIIPVTESPTMESSSTSPVANQSDKTSSPTLESSSTSPVTNQSDKTSSFVSWPLPPLQKADFMWDLKDGISFCQEVSSAYEQVIHWKPNLFLPPSGATGTNFVRELARLLQAYSDNSSLECIALKAVTIMQHLLLQKPCFNCQAKNNAKYLKRRLELWQSGDIEALLIEGQYIQKRLGRKRWNSNKVKPAQLFARKIKQGNIQGALRTLSTGNSKGVLNLGDKVNVGAVGECTVREILAKKHPASSPPCSDTLLPDLQQIPNHFIFDSLNADLILKAAFKTKGAAGLSGLDSFGWRRLCSSFKSASRDLCSSLAAVGRRLCTSLVNPEGLSAFIACRLIPLDKCPGVRPIGIGKFLEELSPKRYYGFYLQISKMLLVLYNYMQVNRVAAKLQSMPCSRYLTIKTLKGHS